MWQLVLCTSACKCGYLIVQIHVERNDNVLCSGGSREFQKRDGVMQVCNPPPPSAKKKKDGWSDEDSKMTKILPFCWKCSTKKEDCNHRNPPLYWCATKVLFEHAKKSWSYIFMRDLMKYSNSSYWLFLRFSYVLADNMKIVKLAIKELGK